MANGGVNMVTYPHVFVETRRLTEALAADGAFVRAMFFVYVQDVDTQPISLLERPGTNQGKCGFYSSTIKRTKCGRCVHLF